uniref:Uncharacterized protein n=1 Tax=Plectus sambesii TaxID=2011161 RepID=A0A914WYG9_9BILA
MHSRSTGAHPSASTNDINGFRVPRILIKRRSEAVAAEAMTKKPKEALDYKYRGIFCSQCKLEICGSIRSVYFAHILDHAFVLPRYLQHLRIRCKLCPTLHTTMNVTKILEHYLKAHPTAALSQVFLSQAAAKPVFTYLNTCITGVYVKAAEKVWSLIDKDWMSFMPLAQSTLLKASMNSNAKGAVHSPSDSKSVPD